MPDLDLPLDMPLDLLLTLRPLVRGQGDRTIRLAPGRAWWTTRTPDGPASLLLRHEDGRLRVQAFGPGADRVLERAARLVGVDAGSAGVHDLAGVDDPRIDHLVRRFPGVRLSRTEAVFDALLPAILEQKVTGLEARRAWQGLVRDHGESAPGPPDLVAGLRGAREPSGPICPVHLLGPPAHRPTGPDLGR